MQCTSEGVDLVPELVPASCSILGGHKLSNAANQVLSTFFALRRRIRGAWEIYVWLNLENDVGDDDLPSIVWTV